jgi:hypothetical protein
MISITKLHTYAGLLHGLNFLAILILALTRTQTGLPTYKLLVQNMTATSYDIAIEPTGRYVYPSYLILLYFAVTCLMHLAYAIDYRQWYSNQLSSGVVWARWVEYSITASPMQVIFFMFSGNAIETQIINAVMLTVLMMSYGALSEASTRPLLVYLIGVIPFAAVLATTLTGLVNAGSPPDWIYALVVFVQVILFGCFGAVRFFSIVSNESPQRIKSERMYIILSFVSKTIMGWIVIART